jgi:hypothetical protein
VGTVVGAVVGALVGVKGAVVGAVVGGADTAACAGTMTLLTIGFVHFAGNRIVVITPPISSTA